MAKNGLNGRIWQIMAYIAGIIFAAGIAYGVINNNSRRIENVNSKVDNACRDVIGLQKDVFYIKEKVDSNAKIQQQILKEIQELKK